jgi:putative membrane-bound dehydrogenase-like protein
MRSRVERPAGSGQWHVLERNVDWPAQQTAIIVCDMWDQHWCKGATARVAEMAPRMQAVLQEARRRGVLIIHAPSDTMTFYQDHPQRRRAQQAPKAPAPQDIGRWQALDRVKEAPLPIDDTDGGCDDHPPCPTGHPWRRQIPTLEIEEADYISDNGEEVYNILQHHGIENVIVLGVHTNMCVLGRPFSIRQMVRLGKNVVLMRDMTDTMYNSRMRPWVPHFTGTDLVVEHIEKYWCASVTSRDVLGGDTFRFRGDRRPVVVFLIAENEYRTHETLPQFAREQLVWRGIECLYVAASAAEGSTDFQDFDRLRAADALVVSVRRRTPPAALMQLIRAHVAAPKPVVGIRTASHAFDARPASAEFGAWPEFDAEVLGADYEGHYNNKAGSAPATRVTVVAEAALHPVLVGMPREPFEVTSHLYKNRNLYRTVTPLIEGTVGGQGQAEPVAWVNTRDDRRVFYTSLGSPADFALPAFRRLLLNGILWALDRPIPPPQAGLAAGSAPAVAPAPPAIPAAERPTAQSTGPLAPADALGQFQIADDLELELLLAEPVVAQPVFLTFDERSRLWVVQYRQYPHPAGLKMVSRDNFWRAVYDRVPPPPPQHFPGKDRITIHADTDGDGCYDEHKVFLDGLNIATAVAFGRGGVWVLNPPYLLFYADANRDDAPDGDPVVHLSGFGLEDTHSVANSLCWGPDGWLYGAHGSTVTAHIVRPGLDEKPISGMGQFIWRYQPETRQFEIFAEGGGNAFGLEFDAVGRAYSGHNGGDTRGFHYVQGGYYQKGFGKHGPLSNPYAFGYFPAMAHHKVERFTHTFIIYEAGALPAHYSGGLLGADPLHNQVVWSGVERDGSTIKTRDLGVPVRSPDPWFRPVDIKLGPDGAVYIADWYDGQVNHYRNHEGNIDPSNGRVYRLQRRGLAASRGRTLEGLSGVELVRQLGNENRTVRRSALRLLGDRKPADADAVGVLRRNLEAARGQVALESLWALHAVGAWDDALAMRAFEHPDAAVRRWSVRLMGDRKELSHLVAHRLAQLAAAEPDVEVRSQLASTARRLPAGQALPIVGALLGRLEDDTDPHVPLLLWWAIESKAALEREEVLGWLAPPRVWDLPLVPKHILGRLMRRYAQSGTDADLKTCARLLAQAPTSDHARHLLAGFEEAFRGRSLAVLPKDLVDAITRSGAASLALRVCQADPDAVREALRVLADERADGSQRLQLAKLLGEARLAQAVPALLDVALAAKPAALRRAALISLQAFGDERIAQEVIGAYAQLPAELRTAAASLLVTRPAFARRLLRAVEEGRVSAAQVPAEQVRRLRQTASGSLAARVDPLWPAGGAAADSDPEARIARAEKAVHGGTGSPYTGKRLFTALCSQCHRLFEHGGDVGPDLTPFDRDDLPALLLSVVNPSAEIREGFENFEVRTKDGRELNGFLVERDTGRTVLRGLDGQNLVLAAEEIDALKPAGSSLMPNALLDGLDDQQVRDLFAYLRSGQPLNE